MRRHFIPLTVCVGSLFLAGSFCATYAQSAKTTGEAVKTPDRRPDVVYVPTPQQVVDKMLELAEVKKGDVVELGDALAKKFLDNGWIKPYKKPEVKPAKKEK